MDGRNTHKSYSQSIFFSRDFVKKARNISKINTKFHLTVLMVKDQTADGVTCPNFEHPALNSEF